MKILLVHLGGAEGDELTASLAESSNDVVVVSGLGDARTPWTGWRPDVVVALLEADSAKALDLVEALLTQRPLAGAALLVTGGNELAITAARRRFPDASFARLDSVETALASIVAGE